jgi:hypothetical protein
MKVLDSFFWAHLGLGKGKTKGEKRGVGGFNNIAHTY